MRSHEGMGSGDGEWELTVTSGQFSGDIIEGMVYGVGEWEHQGCFQEGTEQYYMEEDLGGVIILFTDTIELFVDKMFYLFCQYKFDFLNKVS